MVPVPDQGWRLAGPYTPSTSSVARKRRALPAATPERAGLFRGRFAIYCCDLSAPLIFGEVTFSSSGAGLVSG